MKIGITGTRDGWTAAQEFIFRSLVDGWDIEEFHHGDCVGVDEQACAVIEQLYGSPIHTHPPKSSNHRANVGGRLYAPKEYIERNHNIVDAVDLLVAIPKEANEQRRSGTWATYRYAIKQGKPTILIYPIGTYDRYNM